MPAKRTSPKRAARQQRQSARSQERHARREERRQTPVPTFEDEFTKPPPRPNLKPYIPLTESQEIYTDAILRQRIAFGIGPAGTGKTWCAVRIAVELLLAKKIKKIYLTRPAVEAGGERLGFLPGELEEKYEPYLRPFADSFDEILGMSFFEYLLKKKIIEPVPMGFMRGATIKESVLLADEMQNATKIQMKMLLTRIGKGSTMVINGDPRQLDIPVCDSGLMDAVGRLSKIEGVETCHFTRQDIVRDDIVQDIVEAYES